MKNFLMVVNPYKDDESTISRLVDSQIRILGGDTLITDVNTFCNSDHDRMSEMTGNMDCILVLGGDGTLLSVASAIEDIDIPLLGINLGTVGFLTEVELVDIESVLYRLVNDDYTIEERMMLEGIVKKTDGSEYRKSALNDVVVSRAGFSRIICLNVYAGNHMVDTYEADGVVVATPTGSTGYSLSAGGPIVSPGGRVIVITPVSPHSLTAKSIVMSGDEEIRIGFVKKRKTQETEAIVAFDGGSDIGLSAGDEIYIRRSANVTKLIKATDKNFYELLRSKFGGAQ